VESEPILVSPLKHDKQIFNLYGKITIMTKIASPKENPMNQYVLYFTFAVALMATLGSLFFSEILKFPPCVLCWYQRIAMYPIVLLLGAGIYFRDKLVYRYVLLLSSIGLIVAFYHNLLYYKILPESAAPCILGVSCTTKQIEWFGFVTIPSLSLLAFAIITAGMLWYKRNS
jgi:disulfide bond formation protein DsbB